MSMSTGGDKGAALSDINMTPMIDVLLVLLIIFMVITPLTPKGLEAAMPQPPPRMRLPDRGPHGDHRDQQRQVADAEHGADRRESFAGTRLLAVFKTRNERVCFVKADPDLEFQIVARAIDIARARRWTRLA